MKNVTATLGNTGPSDYPTLRDAFNAINAGTHQGAITASVISSTLEGTTPATLNGSGAGAASYTSVLIRPVNDGVSINGNPNQRLRCGSTQWREQRDDRWRQPKYNGNKSKPDDL